MLAPGKPWSWCVHDVNETIRAFRYYAGWADKIVGQVRKLPPISSISNPLSNKPIETIYQTIEVDNKAKLALTRHDPIGVCGQMYVS